MALPDGTTEFPTIQHSVSKRKTRVAGKVRPGACPREGGQMEKAWNTEVWQAFRADDLARARRDVLLCLPKFRGRGGLIFPSHESLAAKAKCCVRTVQRALASAADLGLLTWRERRKRVGLGTERTSNLYTLIVKNPGKPPTGQGVRVASQENPFFLTAAPELPGAAESRAALARIAAERGRKIAQQRERAGRPAGKACT